MGKCFDYPECLRIAPVAAPPSGVLAMPGSKSLANRAILLAGAAVGTSRLRGVPEAEDTDAALAALAGLGVAWERADADLLIHGRGLDFPRAQGDIAIGSSGTVGRFLPGLLAAAPRGEWRLVANPQLAARPLQPLLLALRRWGARITGEVAGQSFPLRVAGGGLSGGEVKIAASLSSQFASGLLLAAPLCRRPATLLVDDLDPDERYLDMTLDLMRLFGARAHISAEKSRFMARIDAPQTYRPVELDIEADANTANSFLALAAITRGHIAIPNLEPSSRQPGVRFLDILSRLGCEISRAGGVTARGGDLPLRGGFSIDMRAMAEMVPTLGVLAVFADKPVTMTHISHIRGHESDRQAALAAGLAQAGVTAEATGDSLTVQPLARGAIRNAVVDPMGDHRLAMAFSLLGAAANGIAITEPRCVAKTCPRFFALLEETGVEVIAIESCGGAAKRGGPLT